MSLKLQSILRWAILCAYVERQNPDVNMEVEIVA